MEASAVPRVAPAGVAAFASPGLLRVLSDDRLVALIRDGNRNAFEAVYDRHYRAILSFCRHMLGCTDEAEDAVQHTFIAAYNDLVSSRKPIRLRAWLFTIARNRCLTILRSRREGAAIELEERATDGLAAQVQRRQDLRDLVLDINRLPEDQRAALVLAEIGALTHDEIGTVIGVPKDKIKALIFQARESLVADRAAREADCLDIREQLSTMRGAALRRTTLRRHLRSCQGCRDYRHELERQRRRLALILPVAPTIALRNAVLGATAGGVTAGAGAVGGGLLGASSLLKGAVGKALIAALLAALGTTGTILVVHDVRLAAPAGSGRHNGTLATTSVLTRTATRLATSAASRGSATPWGATGAGQPGRGSDSWVSSRVTTHALTGSPSNLLSPVWPHEKLVPITTPAPFAAMPAPTSAPVVVTPMPGLSSPVSVLPAPIVTPSRPTLGAQGHSETGGQGPAGLISTGAGLAPRTSSRVSGSAPGTGGSGLGWSGPASTTPTASSTPSTGSGSNSSGSGSRSSGTSTTPISASASGSGSASGPGSANGWGSGSGSGSTTGSGSGSGGRSMGGHSRVHHS